MSTTLTNAVLLNLDPIEISQGALRIEGDTITEAGPGVTPSGDDETYDCQGGVVLPGLVNGHTHLYSALAPGMPMPRRAPKDFHEILKLIWWRLDRALDLQSVEMSGRIGALDALRCGTTTLVDHHASPNVIDGSLSRLEKGIADVGLRAVLCYEVTDRNGPGGTEAGLHENRRYLDSCRQRAGDRFAALVGAHAAFTLSDESLNECVQLATDYKTGVHIHVAEDPCDDAICREQYGAPLVQRLTECGLLPGDGSRGQSGGVAAASIMGHATHLAPQDTKRISGQVAGIAHNPRSNMNNRVGYAPVAHMERVQLGTDGIGGDMFTEAKHAWFKACDAHSPTSRMEQPLPELFPDRILAMLTHAARVAGAALDCRLGTLSPGAAADVVITDYVPATPLTTKNASAHVLFALGAQHVRHVLVGGQWLLRDRRSLGADEVSVRTEAVAVARDLWGRMQAIPEE